MADLVMTNGCFRAGLHYGHLSYLERSAKLGKLIVFVDDKERVEALKPGSWVLPNVERIKLLRALRCVEKAIIFKNDIDLIEKICVEFKDFKYKNLKNDSKFYYVKGGDYTEEQVSVKSLVENLGGEVKIIPFVLGYSTSDMIDKIKRGNYK